MEEQSLPIVPFGKYKNKSVLDLLADEKYVEWLKQQSWFPNQKQIYNIVVHQTIPTTNNSKTPEHNRLQNLFLEKDNQQKLLSNLYNNNDLIDGINNLFKDTEIIRCFGENKMPEIIHNLDETTIMFEDKYNWDLVMYHRSIPITILSNLETELFDKIKYKETYDVEERQQYDNNLLLIDQLIDARFKLNKEKMQKYILDPQSFKKKPDLGDYIKLYELPEHIRDLLKKCNEIKLASSTRWYSLNISSTHLYSVNKLKDYKNDYIKEYEKEYEKIFNDQYKIYRLQHYRDIIKKYVNYYVRVYKLNDNLNDNRYEIIITLLDYSHERRAICCELKPTLSDDYPVVLRKLKSQIELTKNDKNIFSNFIKKWVLIIKDFNSTTTTKEQLITIFNQSNIKVVFTDDLFNHNNLDVNTSKEQIETPIMVSSQKQEIIKTEENNSFRDNLLETQQKLLEEQEKNRQLEEKIKQLEDEIQLLKTQKQAKTIKNYFGKK